MVIRRWRNTCCLLIMLAGILSIGTNIALGAAYAEESIEAECYIKDDDDYVFVGNVDIYDESKAAATCNSAYTDCKGQCIGCYLDEDEDDDEYCYDLTGRKFRK